MSTCQSHMPRTFKCDRLNSSTFLIVEDDQYGEHPFIYVKIYPRLLVVSDTGCGGKQHSSKPTRDTLQQFIETYPVITNDNAPLNPRRSDGTPSLPYLIICTHCHYDHISGIPSFRDRSRVILASSLGRSFIENDLDKHSLCSYLGIPTPKYQVSYWANNNEDVLYEGTSLSLRILHTPGHTPDELAWLDEVERHLYVGDSFYERVASDRSYTQAILFPKEGSIIDYMQTLDNLLYFVKKKNLEEGKARLKVGCGHITFSQDACDMISSVQNYFLDVLSGKVPVRESSEKRGEIYDLWQEDGEPRFSLQGPRRLVDDARRHFHIGPSLDTCSIIM